MLLELLELESDSKFINNPKIVALLNAVGLKEKDFLQSIGFDIRQSACL